MTHNTILNLQINYKKKKKLRSLITQSLVNVNFANELSFSRTISVIDTISVIANSQHDTVLISPVIGLSSAPSLVATTSTVRWVTPRIASFVFNIVQSNPCCADLVFPVQNKVSKLYLVLYYLNSTFGQLAMSSFIWHPICSALKVGDIGRPL